MAGIFQPGISFRNIDQFLDFLPDGEKRMTEILRTIILDTLPQCKEKLSYNVPFYKLRKRICFIWPSAIPWGNVKEGVMLGFTNGSQLTDDGYLEKGERKSVYTRVLIRRAANYTWVIQLA